MLRYLIIFILTTSTVFASPTNLRFESAEHVLIGDKVKLQFEANVQGQTGVKLKLPNGLQLTYGEIVALAGDFYGNPDQSITSGNSRLEKKQNFILAYMTLAMDSQALLEVPKIMQVLQDEEHQLLEGMRNGEKPADIYARMITDHNIAWNCITGGLCLEDYPGMPIDQFRKIYFFKPGRYLKLADTNFDHFGKEAIEAYSIGHELALEKALAARQHNNPNELALAYSINAFACHFLTDEFSSGHMRTPHFELYNQIYPASEGSILAAYMHNEESEFGLNVTNQRGDAWKAYGDRYYFDKRNQRNREILQEAMQLSVDAIFTTYQSGQLPAQDKVLELTPNLTKLLNEITAHTNISPLFYWDTKSQQLLRRATINNPNNYEWTENWNGFATLTELENSKGMIGE